MDKKHIRTASLMIAGLLGGCAIGPDYVPPEQMPVAAGDWRQASLRQTLGTETAAITRWWERFDDPSLNRLVEEAFSGNLSLAQAAARVRQAAGAQRVAASGGRPQVSAQSAYTRADHTAGSGMTPPGLAMDEDQFLASGSASWELDLWGRIARLEHAADADFEVAANEYYSAAISLLAEVSLSYVELRRAEAHVDLVLRDLDVQSKLLDLARSRLQAGLSGASSVHRAENQLEQGRAELSELRLQSQAAENRLAVLTGRAPQDGLVAAGGLPVAPAIPDVGLPADLLVRRPDVRAAERRYAAAFERTWAARTERYPTLTLTGLLRLQSGDIGRLLADGLFYSIGPSLQVPLDTGGRIAGTIAVREAQEDWARLDLEHSLLVAVQETEDALAGIRETRSRQEELARAADAAARDRQLAQQRFDVGLGTQTEALNTEHTALLVAMQQLGADRDALAQSIRLYRALGGGWESLAIPADSITALNKEIDP